MWGLECLVADLEPTVSDWMKGFGLGLGVRACGLGSNSPGVQIQGMNPYP